MNEPTPMCSLRLGLLLVACAMGGAADAAGAQEPSELPRAVAEAVVVFYNAGGTTRILGDARVAADAALDGDLAVLEGDLELLGHVRGSVVVINGGLRLGPAARIDGDATVVGGALAGGAEGARIRGELNVYRQPLRYRGDEGGLVYVGPPLQPELAAGRDFGFGRTDLVITARDSYNRVEGLPVAVGPRVRFGEKHPTVFSGRVIYRTASGLRLVGDELGYDLQAAQYLGTATSPVVRFGLGAYSEVVPIEEGGLTDAESSLATFLLHRDYRDHYRRDGWSAQVAYMPPRSEASLTLTWRAERNRTVRSEGPWSLFDNDEAWRPQPLVAEGTLRSLTLAYRLDSRNDLDAPSSGWLIAAELERGLGGSAAVTLTDVTTPEPGPQPPSVTGLGAELTHFTAATIDVRRYARLGRRSRLAARVLAAGALDGGPLPPQRQHALGGEGSLPGYPLFAFDCSARERALLHNGARLAAAYGCDTSVLVQLEYENIFPLPDAVADLFGPELDVSHAARWVLFFDAGRAWNDDATLLRGPGQRDFAGDAGVGIRLGRLGVYWAVPLSGGGQDPNFFVRISQRL